MVVNFILENCHLLSRTDEHHTPTIYLGNSTIMINTYTVTETLLATSFLYLSLFYFI